MRASLGLIVLYLASACGPSGASPEAATPPGPSASADDESAHLAPPFAAADLRAGIPVGTEIKLRVASADKATVIQHWVFTAADADGCTIDSRILDEDGNLIAAQGEGTSSWSELESHAHFPAALTTRSEASVDVAAGHFETWLFEVAPSEPGGISKRFHFARTLPGPPVLMETVRYGQVVTRMELVSRSQP